MPKITLSRLRAMIEIRAKEWMPKALCGPAFHDNQVTNHTPIQAPCAYLLFTQQNSSPFWHLPTLWLQTTSLVLFWQVSFLCLWIPSLSPTYIIRFFFRHWFILSHHTWDLTTFSFCGRQNDVLPYKDVCVLTPRTCECVGLCGKGEWRLLISWS